jgi:hypothetical protein
VGDAGFARPLFGWRRPSSRLDLSRYVWSQALFRFLCEQRTEERFEARARAVMELGERKILAREPEWLAWLARLDALECIRAGAKSPSASERARYVGAMPSLAENGARELFTRDADELALALLVDPACMQSAATFLLYFRAKACAPRTRATEPRIRDDPTARRPAPAARSRSTSVARGVAAHSERSGAIRRAETLLPVRATDPRAHRGIIDGDVESSASPSTSSRARRRRCSRACTTAVGRSPRGAAGRRAANAALVSSSPRGSASQSRVRIVSGRSSRRKVVEIDGTTLAAVTRRSAERRRSQSVNSLLKTPH